MSPSRLTFRTIFTGTESGFTAESSGPFSWAENDKKEIYYKISKFLQIYFLLPISDWSSTRMISLSKSLGERLMIELSVLKMVERASLLKMIMTVVNGSSEGYGLDLQSSCLKMNCITSSRAMNNCFLCWIYLKSGKDLLTPIFSLATKLILAWLSSLSATFIDKKIHLEKTFWLNFWDQNSNLFLFFG